jgi:DNA-binding MarR family transcriptional regulator
MDQDSRKIVLNLFTEIAIVEHLLRNRLGQLVDGELTAGQFGVLNRFVRLGHDREGIAAMAWAFQDDEIYMAEKVDALVAAGMVSVEHTNEDRFVSITPAGREAHARSVARMSPEVEPLLEEVDHSELETTLKVIREFRRTLDNLPDR